MTPGTKKGENMLKKKKNRKNLVRIGSGDCSGRVPKKTSKEGLLGYMRGLGSGGRIS